MIDAATKLIEQQPRGMLITQRDLDMLQSLGTAPFLTTEALEWLHFPHRRPYWEEWLQARQFAAPRPVHYLVTRQVYGRITLLERGGYLHRIVQPVAQTGTAGGRERDAFLLSEAGARLLMNERDTPADELVWFRQRKRATQRTAHAVEIGQVYAAFRAKIDHMPGVRMVDWKGEHHTLHQYDRVQVQRRTASGSLESVSVGIQPDATFELRHSGGSERVFVEVDRGTRALETWRQKMLAYRAYMGSSVLKQRYGTDTFILLATAPSPTQLRQLMRITGEVLGTGSNRHLFCLEQDVHPLTIGAAWQKITAVRKVEKTRNGTPYQTTEVETAPHTFLQ